MVPTITTDATCSAGISVGVRCGGLNLAIQRTLADLCPGDLGLFPAHLHVLPKEAKLRDMAA